MVDKPEEIAAKKHLPTSPPPKLPPPGGDVPPYMLKEIFSNQNKRVVEDSDDYIDDEQPLQRPKQFLTKNQAAGGQNYGGQNVGGPNVGRPNLGGSNVGPNMGGPNLGQRNSDQNPLSKLISPLRDILPRNWFQEDKEEEEEESEEDIFVPPNPLRKPSLKKQPSNSPSMFSPPRNYRKDQRQGPSSSRLPPPNFQGPSKGFQQKFGPNLDPQQKFGPNLDPPFRGGQMRGPNFRSQKGPKQNRNQNSNNFPQYAGNPSSFSKRKILRPETWPDNRSSASKLATPLSVDIDDVETSKDDDDVEETTLRNVLLEMSERATAPAADVGQFHSRLQQGQEEKMNESDSFNLDNDDDEHKIDNNESDNDDGENDGEIDDEDEDDFSKVVEVAAADIRTVDDQEDMMQPLSSDRKTATPKKG